MLRKSESTVVLEIQGNEALVVLLSGRLNYVDRKVSAPLQRQRPQNKP